MSVVGASALSGLFAKLIIDGNLTPEEPLFIAVIVVAPILCASWAAGWAYLNVELWAHRHYLAYLERQIFPENRVTLQSDIIEGTLYNIKPRDSKWSLSYANHLNILVASFPGTVGFVGLGVASHSIWVRGGLYWQLLSVAYVLIVLTLYFRVFYIKVQISRRVKSTIRLREKSARAN